MMGSKSYECCIIGAGPAGLGAALELVKHGVSNILIIERNKIVGGLARTEVYDGARFDIGPHRFFTKSKKINKIWHDTLGEDFRSVSRLTRISYRNQYISYPIKLYEVLASLGPMELLKAMFSFILAQADKKKQAITFEDWTIQKFGRKLYETFFKAYTEKVWGIACNQISAEWASQRIKGLDVLQVLKNSLLGAQNNKIRTLAKQFDYPLLGAGQMYQAISDQVASRGVEVMLNTKVVSINCQDSTVASVDIVNSDNEKINIAAKQFFSSIPLAHFFNMLNSSESSSIKKSVEAVQYRGHITVNLLVGGKKLFPDQWIYLPSPDIQMARLASYNNFSEAMAGGKNKTALSAEYFAFRNKGLWNESDQSLKNLAIAELKSMDLVKRSAVENSWVVREAQAYPVNYVGFQEHYDILKSRMDQFANLYSIGRAGTHKYNNQDHSIMSGILAAHNYLRLPGSPYSLWDINTNDEYYESAMRDTTL
ncbi:NAD(P)-binding protein [Candidatus Omnitrophota bacterium]